MEFWQYLLLVLSVVLGGSVNLLLSDDDQRWKQLLPLLLSFSGAYLLGVVALELIPETFGGHAPSGLGLYLLLGFLVQLALEHLSQGVEHGHVHAHANARKSYGIQVMIGLSLHAFLEGLPLAGMEVYDLDPSHDHQHTGGQHLFLGILLHKIPAAFALSLLLRQSGYPRWFTLSCLAVFALMSPLGALLGDWLTLADLWQHRVLALVIGSLLHVSTTILFEADNADHHRISLKKLLTILLGIFLAWSTTHG